ncbi:hypothetical protein ABPG72_003090 [Tetrahymena utriculariae]
MNNTIHCLKVKVTSFCQDKNNILERLLNYLQTNYKQFQDLNYFYDNTFYLVLTSQNTQRSQEVGLVIHRIANTEQIETKYSPKNDLNQIKSQVQFGQLFSSLIITIQNDENNVLELNQDLYQQVFFVQELRIIHTENYKKENKTFTLQDIDQENSQQVSQLDLELPWNQSYQENEEIINQQLEICKNVSRLKYYQQYKEISKLELDQLLQKIGKCDNLVDLGLYFRIKYETIDFDKQLMKLQNLLRLASLLIKLYTYTDQQYKLSCIRIFSELNQLQIFGHYPNIKNKLDLPDLAETISQLKDLNYLTIQFQDW